MASAKAKIRHLFGDTFSCRAAPPDILVKLGGVSPVKGTNSAWLFTRGKRKALAKSEVPGV